MDIKQLNGSWFASHVRGWVLLAGGKGRRLVMERLRHRQSGEGFSVVSAQLLVAARLLNRASHLQNVRVVVVLGLVIPICSRGGRCSYQRSQQVLIALTLPDAEHRLRV